MHKDQDAFRDAGRRSCQEMVAAINAADHRSAIVHQRLAAMHAGRAASLIATS